MVDMMDDNDPFEEDIVFDQAGLLGGKSPRSRHHHNAAGFLPTFMLFSRTIFLCIAFIGLGLCASISRGPIINLQHAQGVAEWETLHTFTAHSVGAFIGGAIGSKLFDIYNRQFLVFVSLVWVSTSVAILPFTLPLSLWWMRVTLIAISAGIAFLFTGGNVLCLDLWGRESGGSSLQALHFSFALGAFLAPVIIHPFFAGQLQMALVNSTNSSGTLNPNDHLLTTNIPAMLSTLPPAVTSMASLKDMVLIDDDDNQGSFYRDKRASQNSELSIPEGPKHMTTEELFNLTFPHDDLSNASKKGYDQNDKSPNITSLNINLTNHVEPNMNKSLSSSIASLGSNSSASLTSADSDLQPDVIKPAKPKPAHTGATVEDEEKSIWKIPLVKPNPPPKASPSPPATPKDNKNADSAKHDDVNIQEAVNKVNATGVTNDTEGLTSADSITNSTSSPVPVLLASSEALAEGNMDSVSQSQQQVDDKLTTLRKPVPTLIVDPQTSNSNTVSKIGSFLTAPNFHPVSTNNLMSGSNSDVTSKEESQVTEYKDTPPDKKVSQATLDGDQISVAVSEPEVLELTSQKLIPSTVKEVNNASSSNGKVIPTFRKPGTYSNITDEANNKFIESIAQNLKEYGVTKINLAFICVGVFVFINSIIFLVILCHNPREPRSKQEEGSLDHAPRSRYLFFTIMFSCFMFTAESLQGAIHHLLSANNGGNGLTILEKGVDGPALFWGLVCVVRFICILLSGCIKLKPGKLLAVAVFFTTLGTIFLSIGSFGKDDFLWSGLIIAAIGLAPTLPTSLLWMSQFMHLTHRMCALMIVLTSFGNSLTHGGLAHIAANSHIYSYILVCISLVSIMLLVMSWCVLYTSKIPAMGSGLGGGLRRVSSGSTGVGGLSMDPSSDGYQLARQQEDDDGMEMSRQILHRPSLTRSLEEEFALPVSERSQHRQLRHMHDLEHEEAGQSLLID